MNDEKTKRNNWKELIPHGRSAVISLIIVAVVAFSLGGLMLGNGESTAPKAVEGEHGHGGPSASSSPTIWTCSMHPQIRLPKPGKCPICFMDLIPVESGLAGNELDPSQIRMSETAVKLAGIQTTPVVRAYAERQIRMVGKLDYDETRVSYITAWVPGRLDKLFIDYTGAKVSKGDPMVQIYSPELIATQEELLQAQKAVKTLGKASSPVLQSTAEETLRSAREKLRLYGLSESQIASIEEGQTPLDHLTITAPTGGLVVHKDSKEGMYVSIGTRIYTIADLSKMWILLEAYESDLPWLAYGQQVSFTSPSFPGETFKAIIDFIDPLVDPKTRTIRIRAVVNNADGRLKPDMFVSGTVESQLDDDGKTAVSANVRDKLLLIPTSAPLITGKRAVVYVKVPDDEGVVFEGREITLGPRTGDSYVVKDGLKEGEEIVTNGAFKIDSELQIQAKPSMMSPEGGTLVAGHQHGGPEQDVKPVSANIESEIYSAGSAERLNDCEEAQIALIPVYNAYLEVQMALAGDSLTAANSAFEKLIKAASSVDMKLFEDEAHARWMNISKSIVAAASIGKSAQSIIDARDAFFHLSLAAIELHDTFGHAGDSSLYLTFCPMAKDGDGAYWLQRQNVVWNSFYGEAMLRCGEIKKELMAGN